MPTKKRKGDVLNMEDKFDVILDFCIWLSWQGLAYETLYYGSQEDVEQLIEMYLKDEEWFNAKKENKGE